MAKVVTRFVGSFKKTSDGRMYVYSARHGQEHSVNIVKGSVDSGDFVTVTMETDPEANTKHITVEVVPRRQFTGCVCIGQRGTLFVSTKFGWIKYCHEEHSELVANVVFQTTKVAAEAPNFLPNDQGSQKEDENTQVMIGVFGGVALEEKRCGSEPLLDQRFDTELSIED